MKNILPISCLAWLLSLTFNLSAQSLSDDKTMDGFVSHGQLVISYNSLEEALTFDPLQSSRVIKLDWQTEKIPASGDDTITQQVFTSSVSLPDGWAKDEKFLYIYFPKTTFMLEVSENRIELSHVGVNTNVRLTPLLQSGVESLTFRITCKGGETDISQVAQNFLLVARPSIHNESLIVHVNPKLKAFYRPLTWGLHSDFVNFTDQVIDTRYIRREHYTDIYKSNLKYNSDSTEAFSNLVEPGNRTHWSIHHYNGIYDYIWTAETPNLIKRAILQGSSRYNAHEALSEQLGVRMAEEKNGELRINNVPVKLNPVSYRHPALHEQVPSKENLREYVIQLKRHNVNTILVSGMPVNADLYELADAYGLYIIQQIDNAAEGASDTSLWMLQQLSMIHMLRNRPSLIAWQLESGEGATGIALAQALKDSIGTRDAYWHGDTDPQRPVFTNRPSNMPESAPQFRILNEEKLRALEKAYQPLSLWVTDDTKQSISIRNGLDFAALEGLTLQWKITNGDKIIQQGEIRDFSIAKGKILSLQLPFKFRDFEGDGYVFSFSVHYGDDLPWAEKGHMLAWEQFKYNTTKGKRLELQRVLE